MVINTGAFKAQENGRSYVTDGIRKHSGPFIITQGPVDLPDGSIGTAELAPNAASQLIGSYVNTVSWTLPQAGVWTESPIQAQCTFTGMGPVRVEFAFAVGCPTKGQRVYWIIYLDGAYIGVAAVGALDAPEANYGAMASGTYYIMAPPVGSHRVAIGINGPAGAVISSSIYSTLYVTEQKR